MLVEALVTVYMIGLMTHIGDDSVAGPDVKTHVAIVKDQLRNVHVPVILIAGEDLDPPQSIPFYYQLRKNDVISFNLPGSGAEAEARFQTYVPSLTEPLTNALLDDSIKSMNEDDEVIAWMKYPAGKLDVGWFHPATASFVLDNKVVRTQCVPESTKFTATATSVVTMTVTHSGNASPTTVRLNPDATVTIFNQAPEEHPDTSTTDREMHFTNYGGVLKRRNLFTAKKIAKVRRLETLVGSAPAVPCKTDPPRPNPLPFPALTGVQSEKHEASAKASHATFTTPLISVSLFRFFLSDHPACTNTDWP